MRSVSAACRPSARYAPLDRRQKAIVCPTWPAPPISGPGEPLQHQHYVQRSGTVNALDAGHLDVGGSGGSGDGGERRRAELLHASDGFRQGFHDLLRPDHAKMITGHQGNGAARLTGSMAQDDGAGESNRRLAASEHAVTLIERGIAEVVVLDEFEAIGEPARGAHG